MLPFIPIIAAVGASSLGTYYVTKSTATDVIEASKPNAPLVNMGDNFNLSSMALVVLIALAVGGFFVFKKKKGK